MDRRARTGQKKQRLDGGRQTSRPSRKQGSSRRGHSTRNKSDAQGGKLIFGKHAVYEALKSGQSCAKIYYAAQATGLDSEFFRLAESCDVPALRSDKHTLNRLAGKGVRHQGVVAELLEGFRYSLLEDLEEKLTQHPCPLIVALERVQDPGNLGNIIRSCDQAGAQGVLLSARSSAGWSPAVARSSAGATAWVPIVRCLRFASSLERLKEQGFTIVGTHLAPSSQDYRSVAFDKPTVLVLGNEENGLSSGISAVCDVLVRLPVKGQIQSLNVASSTAVLLYQALSQREHLLG